MGILASAGYPKLIVIKGIEYPNSQIKRDGAHHIRIFTESEILLLSIDDIERIEVTDSTLHLS